MGHPAEQVVGRGARPGGAQAQALEGGYLGVDGRGFGDAGAVEDVFLDDDVAGVAGDGLDDGADAEALAAGVDGLAGVAEHDVHAAAGQGGDVGAAVGGVGDDLHAGLVEEAAFAGVVLGEPEPGLAGAAHGLEFGRGLGDGDAGEGRRGCGAEKRATVDHAAASGLRGG